MLNGINIKTIQTKKFKTVCIAILIRQKLTKKYATLNAMLPIILPMGCEKYKNIREINIKTEQFFGADFFSDILKKGEEQMLEFILQYVDKDININDTLSFLTEILLNPLVENGGFNKGYFEKAKKISISNIQNNLNDKGVYARNRCIEIMCSTESFGVCADGYLEDFEGDKITPKSLYAHYQDILKKSDINIMIIGDINSINDNDIGKHFKGITRDYSPIKLDSYNTQKHKEKYITEDFDVVQSKLCLGFRTGICINDAYFYALLVANEMLGGYTGSILFNNVREKESLCYYINSSVFIYKGILMVQCGINSKDYEKVIEHIRNEIENIKNGNFSENNMQNAIESLCKKHIGTLDYNTSILDYYISRNIVKSDITIEETIKNIKNVSKNDVVKSLQNIWLDTCYFMRGDEN